MSATKAITPLARSIGAFRQFAAVQPIHTANTICRVASRRARPTSRALGARFYSTSDDGEGGSKAEEGDGNEEAAEGALAEEEEVGGDAVLTDSGFEEGFGLRMDGLDEREKDRKGKIKRRFTLPAELKVPGTEDERRYRTGVTRGLGDVAAGRSHITELRTVEAYRLYGDMDRIKRTDFFHLTHNDVRKHAKKLIAAGKVTPWTPPAGDQIVRYSWKNFLTPTSQQHDAARKVKLEVKISGLGLDEVARETLVQLVGPRYNKGTGVLKLVSDKLPLREQNKAYLDDLLTTIVLEAKNPETQEIALAAQEERQVANSRLY